MKRSVSFLILLLLLMGNDLVFAQRSSTTELWHEVIRLQQQFQKEKSEIIKARQRLTELKKTLKNMPKPGVRP